MTDQPKWMPSETELDDLVGRIEDAYDGPNTSSLACSILAGAIRAAVERALAEQEACYRREVLQAKIDTLDDLWHATKRDHSGKAVEVAFASHVTPSFIREEVDRLAAELAALDAGEEAKP